MGVGEQGGKPGTEGEANCSKAGAARGATEAKDTTATAMSRRKIGTDNLPVRTHDDCTGEKYRVGRTLSDRYVSWSSVAAAAPGPKPDPPRALLPGHASSGTPANSALGVTVGAVET